MCNPGPDIAAIVARSVGFCETCDLPRLWCDLRASRGLEATQGLLLAALPSWDALSRVPQASGHRGRAGEGKAQLASRIGTCARVLDGKPRDTVQAMSKENVEVVRRSYEALLQGDWDQVAQLHDPDVELHGTVGGPSEGSVRRGVQQITQAFEQKDAEASDDTRVVMERFIDAGDRVLMLLDDFGPGEGSDVEADMAVVYELRNGRVIRIQGYMDRASAFKAAGLSEAGG